MAPDDHLDLLSSVSSPVAPIVFASLLMPTAKLLTSLRNTKATFGESSAQYREMKAWVDDHISASAATAASAQAAQARPAGNANEQAAAEQERLPQQQHVFNLAFRPRPQGAGYAQ